MSSQYPDKIDLFELKHDATSQDDPAGDYVMADDVNDLQDSIVAIETTLGVNPQGSTSSVAERMSKLEGMALLRVPPILIYLGKPGLINGATTTDEAVSHYLKYDHVVLGAGAEDPADINHNDAKVIIEKVKVNRDVKFYGYINAGIISMTISEIQVKINQWQNLKADGIFLDNFGYSSGVSRERQNLILDSIHQYGMPAFINALNPDEVFSDVADTIYNPNWTAPRILTGDIYLFTKFAVDTIGAGYTDASTLFAKMDKLYDYKNSLGIKIFATALIQSTVPTGQAQTYFDYAHALAILSSLDGFYAVSENYGSLSNNLRFYEWAPVAGQWYIQMPEIIHSVDYKTHSRQTGFGSIAVDTALHTFQFSGASVPSYFLRLLPNSIDGSTLKDASISDNKISSYNASRLVAAINASTSMIDIDNIMGLVDGGGGITEGLLKANVIQAINASIGSAQIQSAKIGNLEAEKITTGILSAGRISASVVAAINLYAATMQVGDATIANAVIGQLSVDNMSANVIQAVNISTQNISAARMTANVVDAINVSAKDIAAERMRANVVSAINLYSETITVGSARIDGAVIGTLEARSISARIITSDMIRAGTITSIEIAAGAITGDRLQAGTITSNEIQAGSITSNHIVTDGLDAKIISIHNSQTGQVLIGGGYLRVDGLDVGVVQSDNLATNGLFLTASSAYGFLRDNPVGEVILGSQGSAVGGHQVWKIDTGTGIATNKIDINGKKPFSIALDAVEKYAYVSVQGDNTIRQIDLTNNVVTDSFLKSEIGPGRIVYTGKHLSDHKHFFVLGSDPDDLNIPDSLMIIDAAPTSINSALYMHHVIPLGNRPYDVVMDNNHWTYITMADQGDILVFDMNDRNSTKWKIIGRIPITAYITDNYHGGLPGQFGLGTATGGSASISYQQNMGMSNQVHAHGGYGAADGSLKKYEPRGLALSTDTDTLYVIDHVNNQLVVADKYGKGLYNALSGTREQGNLGEWGTPTMGGTYTPPPSDPGHIHSMAVPGEVSIMTSPVLGPAPLPTDGIPRTEGTRTYTYTNGETPYVRYRIPIGDSPEFVECHMGKIFVTLSGSGKIAVIDEQQVIDAIVADRAYAFNEFKSFPPEHTFNVRYIDVGAKPVEMTIDHTNNKLYVTVNGQNQVVVINMMDETILQRISVGANPRGIALTEDGTTLYVANYGGTGNISFVYTDGPYFGDAYLGMEGQVNHHGASGWMPKRANWTYEPNGTMRSSSTIEFRINEPFLEEGGYVRMSSQGKDPQISTIEQDIIGVTNYSDGTNPAGTWFHQHNASAQVAIANGSSTRFYGKLEVDELVPKVVVLDNQQTEKFTPTQDGINQEYTGLEYSVITNQAIGKTATSPAIPIAGTLDLVTNNDFPDSIIGDVTTTNIDTAPYVTLPEGLQSVTVDLGKIYMIGKLNICHMYNVDRKYHGTKTEVSEDGFLWITVYDSAVSGEYNERTYHPVHGHTHYGAVITFNAKPVRYVRDWASGWISGDGLTSGTENTWAEVRVHGDWEVIKGLVYPPQSDKAGQSLATNGNCFVETDISKAYIAVDLPIEFTSWSWMSYIGGPDYGTMVVEMPSLMSSDHFVDQNWPYLTNLPHRHIMTFPPSINIKADVTKGIKAGKHRLVLKQSSGRVTLDRMRFDDFQLFNTNSLSVSRTSSFRREKVLCEQAKAYQGVGRQSTEGVYDEPRRSPDTGLPDKSVPIKYRVRIKADLEPEGTVEERGILYTTSVIMEKGKLSSHWRMSQSSDVFPGTRIESWDPTQPHKTGIQSSHLANGSVRGSKLMPSAVMNHHISSYARIAEFKLDLNYPTHAHGRWFTPAPGAPQQWIDNKVTLDQIEGWGASGTANKMAREDHAHTGMLVVSGVKAETLVPIYRSGTAIWSQVDWSELTGKPTSFPPVTHTHTISDVTDLATNYYNKSEVDAKITAGPAPGTGTGGDVHTTYANVFTDINTFSKPGLALLIKPSSSIGSATTLFRVTNISEANYVDIDNSGSIIGTGTITMTGNVTAGGFTTTGSASIGSLTVTGASTLASLSVSGITSLTGVVTLGAQATAIDHALRADRQIITGAGLTGGGDLTTDRTLSISFAGSGTANTASHSDHGHSNYLSNGTDQSIGTNFTVNGIFYAGAPATGSGDIVVRNAGNPVIHFDGDSSGKISASNVKSYISGNGDADFAGNVKAGSLSITSIALVTNLNAQMLNSLSEGKFAKNESLLDAMGYGVHTEMFVQAQAVPNMSVMVKAGTVYSSTGRRYTYNDSSISLAQSSANFDRIDVLYVQGQSGLANEGVITVMTGTPASPAVEPAIPSDAVKLATVYVKQNIGSITDGFNRGAVPATADGSYAAITNAPKWKDVRYDKTTKILNVEGYLRAAQGAKKVTIVAGQTFVTWTHSYGNVNYAVAPFANGTARHLSWKNQTANTIDICIDDPHTANIDVLVILIGY